MEHVSTVRVTCLSLFSLHALLLCFASSLREIPALHLWSCACLVHCSESILSCVYRSWSCAVFFFFILQVSDKLTVLSEPALCYQHGWGCCDWPGVRSRRSDLSQVWTIPKKDPSPARSLRGRYKRNHSWRTAQALWNTGHQFVLQPGTS